MALDKIGFAARTRSLVLATILITHSSCVEEIRERCPLVTDGHPAPALPRDFAPLDDLLYHRALQMMHDVRELRGSATTSFHIWFAKDTLPLWCGRLEQARDLARVGQVAAAGRKYQALLVFSQLMELAVAVHAVVEYADAVKEPSLVLVRVLETFGNQMEPILAAALSEDPDEIRRALEQNRNVFAEWSAFLARWTARIRADAERMAVAKIAWDLTVGAIAAYEAAGALAGGLGTGGPPFVPAFAGGEAVLAPAAQAELAEAIRRLIASGALDAGVVAALSSSGGHSGILLAVSFGSTPERAALLERVIVPDGTLNTSKTVAQQLKGPRSYVPVQSILETIGAGTRIVDPKGIPGHFMYRAAAVLNGTPGTLEVLVEESSGQIRHVLFLRGALP
jgi:hypothetical protein